MSWVVKDFPLQLKLKQLVTRLLETIGPAHIRARKHCFRCKGEIEASDRCGCFYCLEIFARSEIEEWTDDGMTPFCPRCGIDSVIGSASGFPLSRDFLGMMHRYWFERSYRVKLRATPRG